MKKIANYSDEKLRKDQFHVLVDVVWGIKSKDELAHFLATFLSESEAAYIGQRLDIMRMLAKKFSYSEIKEKLGVSSTAISNAQKFSDEGGEDFLKIILAYKYKKPKTKTNDSGGQLFINKPHYPGSMIK